jgi:N-formylglutamate deformylase
MRGPAQRGLHALTTPAPQAAAPDRIRRVLAYRPDPVPESLWDAARDAAAQCGYDHGAEKRLYHLVLNIRWVWPASARANFPEFFEPTSPRAENEIIRIDWRTYAVPECFDGACETAVIERVASIIVDVSTLVAGGVVTSGLGPAYNVIEWREGVAAGEDMPDQVFDALSDLILTDWREDVQEWAGGNPACLQEIHPRLRNAVAQVLRFPPWLVVHVPHDATAIPPDVRGQFLPGDQELTDEILRMTDHFTYDLFLADDSEATVVRAEVSRLVVDVERFADDAGEPMAARGMGAIYNMTSALAPLRRQLSHEERASLLRAWYQPHHRKLETAVTSTLDQHGRCLILDCHSFPSTALPYELADASIPRPDICIGTDPFHTSELVARAFLEAFAETSWSVALNQPFAGAIVPASRYGRDNRVEAVMVEVNRRLYLDEANATRSPNFADVSGRIRACCIKAMSEIVAHSFCG